MIEGSRVRLTVIGVVIMFLFSALFARLWFLQVAAGNSSTAAAASNRVRVVYEPALRGRILDRNGKPIVDNTPVDVVTFDRHKPMSTATTRPRARASRRAARGFGRGGQATHQRQELLAVRTDPGASCRGVLARGPHLYRGTPDRLSRRERQSGPPCARTPTVRSPRTCSDTSPRSTPTSSRRTRREGYREGDLIGKDGVEKMFESASCGEPPGS